MRQSADYPDFEAALNAASSQFGATHIVRHGKQATIFSPTSRGYERRTLHMDRGFFHWPRQGDVVDGVPANAEMLIDVLDVGFDPDAPQLGPGVRRAAEVQRVSHVTARKIGDELRVHWPDVDLEQFRQGIEIEQEHTSNLRAAAQIALDHLREDRHYYTKLKRAGLEATRRKLIDFDPATVPEGSVIWLKGTPVGELEKFLDGLTPRGLDMVYAGPGDRYKVVKRREGAQAMGAVREVVERRGHEGRRYEYPEWLEFECEPGKPTPELEAKAAEFKKLVLEFLGSYARVWNIDLSGLDEDSFAWNAYASIVGHGVGLWEGDGDTGLRGDDEKKIDKALRGRWASSSSLIGRLHTLAHEISDECSMLSEGAGGREAGEEASIPTKAQLKIIEAFRARQLRGNPMRDAISTDGDTIFSYRMPIARRTPNGGIWIADAASAPSVTTRNHIYGLQRTFTPAEIMGTRRAAEHDDSPDTERMPAPESAPRLQPGYAFYTPSKRKGDWKKIPNDDWEHVIVDQDEAEKAEYVGTRIIDGYTHDIFEVAFAHGRRSKTTGYWAQLQTHTRGRSAAHELHRASDFPTTKDAIHHAQREWGATHVDFHGTRNTPTVYGMKDGARWKKTLYKEKGKYHWPEKFLRGPKKLRGAIELTPIAAPSHMPPMQRPPMGPTIPGTPPNDSERHLPMQADEAGRRYTSQQSQQDALRDDVFRDGVWIGFVRGPFQRGHSDFYQWQGSRISGEARTRQAAFNALVSADKARRAKGERYESARENPATDLQDAIPWVRVTRDPERYKEAIERAKRIGPIDDARKVYELVGPALLKEDQETFIVVLIDVRQNCRGVAEVHRGGRSRVAVSATDIMRVVIASGAEGFIVCHNHPTGTAEPSGADRDLTKAIERAAKPFKGETAFLDHVVLGADEYFSFADNKRHRMKN